MSSKIPSEGILSGIAPVRLAEVEPPNISDEYWTAVGKVEELFIYPVKSMRGVSVQSADVGKHGLSWGNTVDRQFVIVTETENRSISGRRYPRIVLISAYVDDKKNILTLSTPGMSDINVDIPMEVSDTVETKACQHKFTILNIEFNNLQINLIFSLLYDNITNCL
jgi:hypothetical protein